MHITEYKWNIMEHIFLEYRLKGILAYNEISHLLTEFYIL